MLVLLVFDTNYVIDVTEIAEIVRKLKFLKNVTDWLSEKVTTREAIASKKLTQVNKNKQKLSKIDKS